MAEHHDVDDDDDAHAWQEYILLVLSDSNLPTGGFVASAGLESYWAHGLLHGLGHSVYGGGVGVQSASATRQLVAFIAASLDTYAHTVAAFLLDVHRITRAYMLSNDDAGLQGTTNAIVRLDNALHAMTLNHVAQRASKAQGVALLTLYAKSFAPMQGAAPLEVSQQRANALLQELKMRIRRDDCHGHLPICWAAFMAALGVKRGQRAMAVHLFLQARAILSSAVRLNIVGPYMMHRMLAFDVKALIERTVLRVAQDTTAVLADEDGVTKPDDQRMDEDEKEPTTWQWTWPDEGTWSHDIRGEAPKTTWPLGDLLQARHDQLHSRLFNS